MKVWTLKCDGEEKTFSEWGIRSVQRSLRSLELDTVTFEQPDATAYGEPLFNEGAIVELFRDDVRWFYGRAEDAAPYRNGKTAGMRHTISGPWWWLRAMGFRQKWKARNQAGVLEDRFSSQCILGSKLDGTKQSISDQIAEAVNYAISQDAPLLFDGAGLPTIFPPLKDAFNISVAEVIRRMVEWAPDIVSFLDYSTDPYPTLRMRRRTDQEAVDLDVADFLSELQIQPRSDLKVPGVIIYYLRTDSTNGTPWTVINEDKYPVEITGREPKALLAAINLDGAVATYSEASIIGDPIQAESADWWRRHDGHLQSETIKDLKIKAGSATFTDENGEPVSIAALPNKLVGAWSPWMGGNVQSVNVRALASWSEDDLLTVVDRPLVCQIEATNLATGTYRSDGSVTPGESQPVGLAETLYKAASVLHYDGNVSLKEAQCEGRVSIGKVLNITGGREAWKTMRAQIQGITEHIDTGETQIVFGPPEHLGPADYIELLRATRNRWRFASPTARATGISGGSSAILPKTVSKQVATSGQGGVTQQTWIDPTGLIPGKIVYDLRDCNGMEMRKREWKVCINDQAKYAMIDSSEPYDQPKTSNPIGA